MKHGYWHLVMVLLVLIVPVGRVVRADFYTPPDAAGTNLPQIDALRVALSQHQFADAAKLVDAVLAQHGDELGDQDGTTLRSTAVLIAQTVRTDQVAFTAEFSKQFEAAAHGALQTMKLMRHDDPAGLCSLAARYPFTPTAGESLALAARRSAEIGDLVAAQTLFARAAQAGWAAGADDGKLVDKINRLCSGEVPPAGEHAESAAYVGQLPFDAQWYFAGIGNPGNPAALPEARCFPVSAGSLIFIQTPKRLLALKPNGGTAWSVMLSDAVPAKPGVPGPAANPGQKKLRPDGQNRPVMGGPLTLLPAVLSEDGAAQVVAVKVIVPEQGTTVVRCFRAADGHELWNTSDQETLADLVFQGSPLICGRYTYLLAQQSAGVQSQFLMIALDTTTGREFWRINLGCIAQVVPIMVRGQPQWPGKRGSELVDEPSLSVAGDLVIATPGVGGAIAVNRFTGKLQWLFKYGRMEHPMLRQLRYDSRAVFAGGVVVIAPMDTTRVLGLDADTGAMKWEGQVGESVLCGGSNGNVVLAIPKGLVSLDAGNGERQWAFKPPAELIAGPTVVAGHVVMVPMSAQVTTISLSDGQLTVSPVKIPLVSSMIAPESNRRILQADGIWVNFGVPMTETPKPTPKPH